MLLAPFSMHLRCGSQEGTAWLQKKRESGSRCEAPLLGVVLAPPREEPFRTRLPGGKPVVHTDAGGWSGAGPDTVLPSVCDATGLLACLRDWGLFDENIRSDCTAGSGSVGAL